MDAAGVSALRSALLDASARLGGNTLGRRLYRERLLIVCYHGVVDDASTVRHWLLLRRSAFARQLDFLQRCFEVRALDEAIAELRAGALERPTAAITFDDGYRNNLTVALPELRARRLPATVFLSTGLIGTGEALWTTTVELAVAGARIPRVELADVGGPSLPLLTDAERDAAGYAVKEWLKRVPSSARRAHVARLLSQLAPAPPVPPEFALMSWPEVGALVEDGLVRLGAHGARHEILSRLDDAELARELAESVEALGRFPAARSRVFAYPNGRPVDYDDRARPLLERLGVTAAVTTTPGVNGASTPPFALRRLVVGAAMPQAEFEAEAAGVATLARAVLR
jgi:peptidoglycan/xylan/chitin deacetylase (PgdA/CDA1 family)